MSEVVDDHSSYYPSSYSPSSTSSVDSEEYTPSSKNISPFLLFPQFFQIIAYYGVLSSLQVGMTMRLEIQALHATFSLIAFLVLLSMSAIIGLRIAENKSLFFIVRLSFVFTIPGLVTCIIALLPDVLGSTASIVFFGVGLGTFAIGSGFFMSNILFLGKAQYHLDEKKGSRGHSNYLKISFAFVYLAFAISVGYVARVAVIGENKFNLGSDYGMSLAFGFSLLATITALIIFNGGKRRYDTKMPEDKPLRCFLQAWSKKSVFGSRIRTGRYGFVLTLLGNIGIVVSYGFSAQEGVGLHFQIVVPSIAVVILGLVIITMSSPHTSLVAEDDSSYELRTMMDLHMLLKIALTFLLNDSSLYNIR